MNNGRAAAPAALSKNRPPARLLAARLPGWRRTSPLASDRCTVFMERDISYLLSEGYSVREVLAAVLHAVRDNYLWKVAAGKKIGSKILFQGATAKNRALIAAFEQKLGKPITVSKYCHLTGAYGAALSLLDSGIAATRFRGTGLCRKEIPVTAEVCTLCNNHCKLRVVSIDGERVAFGREGSSYGSDSGKEVQLSLNRKLCALPGTVMASYISQRAVPWKSFLISFHQNHHHNMPDAKKGKRQGVEFFSN